MKKINFVQIIFLLIISYLTWYRAFGLYDSAHVGFKTQVRNKDSPLLKASIPNTDITIMGTSNSNVFHFMQITDIHISRYYKHGGFPHLESFLYHELPLIAPDLLFNTGDLTDAKSKNKLTSLQHPEEWQAYQNLLKQSRILDRSDKRFYWDQRGNHDCWNIPSFTSPKNLFRKLSAIKEEGYSFTLNKPYGVYSFIAIDGCPETGAGRPLNFFASLDTIDMDFLASMLTKSLQEDHNHTFALSHYPISTSYYGRTSDGLGFWDITHHVSVWLSGHLHKLAGGLGETMYAFMDGKVLELELGDMKTNGMFRIVVVDHDMVSFVDLPIESKFELPLHVDHDFVEEFTRGPILVITNPKDGRYMIPGKEPFRNILHSTHIRVLVWCDTEIESLKIFIDNVELDAKAEYNGRGKSWSHITNLDQTEPFIPLWTIPWNPKSLSDEMHIMTAIAVDKKGRIGNHTVRFHIDGSRIKRMDAGTGGFIISVPFGIVFKDLFVILYLIITVLFLLIPKLFILSIDSLGLYEKWKLETSKALIEIDKDSELYWKTLRPSLRSRVQHRWWDFKFTMVATFLRFCELATHIWLFYPLYLFSLYITIGPWFIGDFVDQSDDAGKRYGWLMVYGIWFEDGTWEPTLDTWLYAWYGLLYTLFPLVSYISFCVTSPKLLYCSNNERFKWPIHKRWYSRLALILVLAYHVLDTLSMTLFYGWVSTVYSPGKTWIIIWSIYILLKLEAFSGHAVIMDSKVE